MFYTALSTLLLIPVFIGFGFLYSKIVGNLFEGISGKILEGIFAVNLLLMIAAFFIPVNAPVEYFTLATGLVAFFFWYAQQKTIKIKRFPVFVFGILAILFSASVYPFILDHFGYYVPTITWLTEFGLVQGIANLDLILAQNSPWHILQAGFSHFSDPFLRLNAVLITGYLFYIFENEKWVHLLFIPIFLFFCQSPSPDLPVFIFSLILLDEILQGNKKLGQLFLFSAYIFVIKPTAIWLPIALLILSCTNKVKFKNYIPAVLVVLLFLLKNVWTFGYPVFPLAFPDLHLAWKPNTELMKQSAELGLTKSFDQQYSLSEIRNFSLSEKFKYWLLLPGIKGIINSIFAFVLLLLGIQAVRTRSKMITVLVFAIFTKSLIVLLFSAQYRFFLDVIFAGIFLLFYQFNLRKIIFPVFIMSSGAVAVLFANPALLRKLIPSFRTGKFMNAFEMPQLYQPGSFERTPYKTFTLGNLQFNSTVGYPYTFKTPLPAISPEQLAEYSQTGIFPQLNQNSNQLGFVWKNLSAEEQKQLKAIIHQLNKQNNSKDSD